MAETAAIILAAGISSRMKTRTAKVLHRVCGRPMLDYVLDACREAGITKIYVVIGFGADEITNHYKTAQDIVWVTQEKQLGTAHAVLCCRELLKDFSGNTLILCGDGPLIRSATLKILIDKHETELSAAALATTILDEPAGYGRIVRSADGNIQAIVEHADCSEEQLKIREVNPSYYIFDTPLLWKALADISTNNAKNEYYLTDAIAGLLASGNKVAAINAVESQDALSVNSREQLSKINKIMQERIQQHFMDNGVTIVSPENTWIESNVIIGPDTVIEPFTFIGCGVRIEQDSKIGPFACLKNESDIHKSYITCGDND